MASVPRVAALGVSRALRVLSRSQLTATRPLVAPRRTYLTSSKSVNRLSAVPGFLACTRGYSAAAAISENDLKDRVLNVLKLFDKVNPEMVSETRGFMQCIIFMRCPGYTRGPLYVRPWLGQSRCCGSSNVL